MRTVPKMLNADVVIVGAGATGTLVACQLLRQSKQRSTVVLVEKTGQFAQGLAYSTTEPHHLLNVPARSLSAYPEDPEHFLRWLLLHDEKATPHTFAPRRLFRLYLMACLMDASRASPAQLIRIADEVVDFDERSSVVTLRASPSIHAGSVVLAMGNEAPAPLPAVTPSLASSPLYRRSPWERGALEDLEPGQPVLLIGTGLTMVDAALSLRARSHQGPILALSRHGLVPHRHADTPAPVPITWEPEAPDSVRRISRQLRSLASEVPWRSVVDGLRPLTQALWQGLPAVEQARFLRHLRAYWDIHRHRMAPPVADAIDAMRASGQLQVLAGRLRQLSAEGGLVRARCQVRAGDSEVTVLARRVINCTGPASLKRAGNGLIDRLAARGVVRFDWMGFGLDTLSHGECLSTDGVANTRLFTAGPMRRGNLWESTAIPEIRAQADALAHRLLSRASVQELEARTTAAY